MTRPDILSATPDKVGAAWFAEIAATLLNRTAFMVGGQPYRFGEVEFYYTGGDHEDPFTHCDPIQRTTERWYFHRDEGSYRGGSFKGLDITFGPEGIFGGILIRTILTPRGEEINGCSLAVDHLLAQTGFATVAELDAALGERSVWEQGGPLALVLQDDLDVRRVWATARVGLTLKRMYKNPTMPRYILRDYRFLTDPRIKKGKVYTILALHKAGHSAGDIQGLTGSPRKSVQEYIDAYNEGLAAGGFNDYRGEGLGTRDLCLLHGIWQRHYGDDRG